MREIVLDPNGNVLDPSMLLLGQMLPIRTFITRAPSGEVVQILLVDGTQPPQGLWNMSVFG